MVYITACLMYSISPCNRPERSNDATFPITKKSSDVIRIISYNIRGESTIDRQHDNGWDVRKNKIHFLLQHYQPDIIGLQGISTNYMSDIYQLFPEYICITQNPDDVLLLLRSDRFFVENQQFFLLTNNHKKQR